MNKPSVKIILRKKRASDKQGYLCLRIGIPKVREPIFYSLGYNIQVKEWNAKTEKVIGHIDSVTMNIVIQREKQKLVTRFNKDLLEEITHTRESVKRVLGISDTGDFIAFWRKYIQDLAKPDSVGQVNISPGYERHLNSQLDLFISYAGEKVPYSQITTEFLKGYEAERLKTVRFTTLATNMKRIMEPVKLCKELGLIKPEQLAGYKLPVYNAPLKGYHVLDELRELANGVYSKQWDYPHMVTGAFYFLECCTGMRHSDWKRFHVETLTDRRALKLRTLKNKQDVYLYLDDNPALKDMVEFIEANNLKFRYGLSDTNTILREIGKSLKWKDDLTTHKARKTCATILGEIGYTNEWIADIIGCSPQTVKVYRQSTAKGVHEAQKRLGGIKL